MPFALCPPPTTRNQHNQQPETRSVSPVFQERRELSVGLLWRKAIDKLIPRSGATRNLQQSNSLAISQFLQ